MTYKYKTKIEIPITNNKFNNTYYIPELWDIEVKDRFTKRGNDNYYEIVNAVRHGITGNAYIGKYINAKYLNDSNYVKANDSSSFNRDTNLDFYTVEHNIYAYKYNNGRYFQDSTKNLKGLTIGIQSNQPVTITYGNIHLNAYKIQIAQKRNGNKTTSMDEYEGFYVGTDIFNEKYGVTTSGGYKDYSRDDKVSFTKALTVKVDSLQIYTSIINEERGGYHVIKPGAKSNYQLKKGDIIEGIPLSSDQNCILIEDITLGQNNDMSFNDKINIINDESYVFIKDNDSETNNLEDTTEEDINNSNDDTSSVTDLLTRQEELGAINDTLTDYAEDVYTADEFLIDYEVNTYSSSEEYIKGLQDNSLKITSLRSIFGSPHQFLPDTDARPSSSNNTGNLDDIGRLYGEKILKNMPILFITPGTPDFLAGFNKDQKESLLSNLITSNNEDEDLQNLINNNGGRYYSLKFDYTSYFKYVNAMLRSAAIFLGIGDKKINGRKLSETNWMLESTSEQNGSSENTNNPIENALDDLKANVGDFLGLQQLLGPHYGCLAFYADCGNQVDDSFSNSTTQSQIASSLNSLSDMAKEMNFIVGTAGSNMGLELDELMGKNIFEDGLSTTTDFVDKAIGQNNIISNILSKAQTLLSGGRMIFPEIWADSSFSRSYSARMKLVSPSGDKLSIYLDILVPIYHLLALVLPRQSATPEGYFSPFLIRAYSKGLFNVDMGIITDLNITKGAEAEWSVDGIPTVAEVSFTIKDLYDGMSMSTSEEVGKLNILSNTAELDYIANSCGVNINDQDVLRTIKMASMLGYASLKDLVEINIFGEISQWWDQKMQNVFGAF